MYISTAFNSNSSRFLATLLHLTLTMEFVTWYLKFVAAVIILFLYVYWKFGMGLDYWKKRKIFFLQPTLFFGNIKDLLLLRDSEANVFQKIYNKLNAHAYGGIFQINNPALVIKDPELIKSVMVKDFGHFHDRGLPVDEKRNPLGAHLFTLAGQRWRNLRIKLTPTFTSGKMKAAFSILIQCSEEMLVSLEKRATKKETLYMKEIFAQMTTDVIGSYAFGLQLNSIQDPNSEFRNFGRKVFAPSLVFRLRLLVARFSPFLGKIINKYKSKKLENFFLNAVGDTVKYREQNNIKRNDFLQLLIQLKNKGKLEGDVDYSKEDAYLQSSLTNGVHHDSKEENDIVLTDNLLAAQCFVFFIAGFETSSTTASFCLHELAVNPDIQERLRDEVDSVLKEYDGKITYEGIQKMKYMDMVVDGMRFGLLQTKVELAALLSKYKFSMSEKTTVPIIFEPKAPVLTAKGGIWLQISKRS